MSPSVPAVLNDDTPTAAYAGRSGTAEHSRTEILEPRTESLIFGFYLNLRRKPKARLKTALARILELQRSADIQPLWIRQHRVPIPISQSRRWRTIQLVLAITEEVSEQISNGVAQPKHLLRRQQQPIGCAVRRILRQRLTRMIHRPHLRWQRRQRGNISNNLGGLFPHHFEDAGALSRDSRINLARDQPASIPNHPDTDWMLLPQLQVNPWSLSNVLANRLIEWPGRVSDKPLQRVLPPLYRQRLPLM